MRKRQLTRTSPKRKLHGLTKAEAHIRAKKAWITKHRRYKYGSRFSRQEGEDGPRQDWSFFKGHDNLNDDVSEKHKSQRQQRKDASTSDLAAGIGGHKLSKDQLWDISEEFAKSKSFQDEETRHLISQLPEGERQKLIAKILQREAQVKRRSHADVTEGMIGDTAFKTVRGIGYSHHIRRVEPGEVKATSPLDPAHVVKDRRKLSREEAEREFAKELIGNKAVFNALYPNGPNAPANPRVAELIRQSSGYASMTRYAQTGKARALAERQAEKSYTRLAQIAQNEAVRRGEIRDTIRVSREFEKEVPPNVFPKLDADKPFGVKDLRNVVYDPKTNTTRPWTTEDLYTAYGQEGMKGVSGIKAQARFVRDQYLGKIKGLRSGKYEAHFDDSLKRTSPKNSKYYMRPNVEYEATLRKKGKPGEFEIKRLDIYDTSHIPRGKRDPVTGKLKANSFDELARMREVQKLEPGPHLSLGRRTVKNRPPLEQGIDQEVFIPKLGIKRRSSKHVVNDEFVPPAVRGEGHESVVETSRSAPKRKTKVTFVPHEDMTLLSGESDVLDLAFRKRYLGMKLDEDRLSGQAASSYGQARRDIEVERLSKARAEALRLHINQEMNNPSGTHHTSYETVYAFGGVPLDVPTHQRHITGGQDFTRGLRHEINARTGSPYRNTENNTETNSALKEIRMSAIAAAYYAQRRRTREHDIPILKNKVYQGLRKTKLGAKVADKVNAPDAIEAWNRGPKRKITEAAYDKWWALTHPTSSPTGLGQGLGLDMEGLYYRRNWLIKPETVAARQTARRTQELERVARNHEFFSQSAYTSNPVKRLLLHKREGILRSDDYKNFDNTLVDEMKRLGHLSQDHSVSAKERSAAIKSVRKLAAINAKRKGRMVAEDARITGWKGETLPDVRPGYKLKSEQGPFGYGPTRVVRDRSTASRNVMIGGGVAATVIGGAYLHHRYAEKKRRESEGVDYRPMPFYNKLLPPPITVPGAPKVRTLSHYKFGKSPLLDEVHLSGRTVPTKFGVSFEKKTIKSRPWDRGYKGELGLTGIRMEKGTKEGSLRESLKYPMFDQRSRSWEHGTHGISIKGKRAPIYLNIGQKEGVKLSGVNPQRLTAEDYEKIARAYVHTPQENEVRRFYAGNERMDEAFTNARGGRSHYDPYAVWQWEQTSDAKQRRAFQKQKDKSRADIAKKRKAQSNISKRVPVPTEESMRTGDAPGYTIGGKRQPRRTVADVDAAFLDIEFPRKRSDKYKSQTLKGTERDAPPTKGWQRQQAIRAKRAEEQRKRNLAKFEATAKAQEARKKRRSGWETRYNFP